MEQKKFVIRMNIETFKYLQNDASQNLTSINKLINKLLLSYKDDQEKVISPWKTVSQDSNVKK